MVNEHHTRGPVNVVMEYPEMAELKKKHPDRFPNEPAVT